MSNKSPFLIGLIALSSVFTASCAANNEGFLTAAEVADATILPAPPAKNSTLFNYDIEQHQKNKLIRNTERGKQAVLDAKIFEPNFGIEKVISREFGYEISATKTPELSSLLTRLAYDADTATSTAKKFFMTQRPYKYFHESTCYPHDEMGLSNNGGYPSGHTTYGWATALILAEINPAKQDDILKRGYEIGQSRVICGYHWQSDVEGGRLVGSALVTRLHANPSFLQQLEKAKKEFASISQSKP